MTKTRKVSIAVGVLLLAVAVGLAQGPMGGMGGFGGNPSGLIQIPQVQQELKLTPEQLKKINAAILKAVNDNLEPDQSKRLKQISLQMRNWRAFTDAEVQAELKFTAEQKDSIKTILTDESEKRKALIADGEFQKLGELAKETQAKVMEVVTDAQKDQFKEMIGAQFKLDFFKGFKFKKKEE